jgi:hemoglobin-like flavoprotein
MTPQQSQLVTDTWKKVAPIADTAATLFYGRLFELDPALKSLFPNDLTEQKKKLMMTLAFAVGSLNNPDALLPAVRQLGKRHAGYGIRDAHFDTVGAALLWTLEKGLGDAWNTDVAGAWATVYGIVASTMKEGMREA